MIFEIKLFPTFPAKNVSEYRAIRFVILPLQNKTFQDTEENFSFTNFVLDVSEKSLPISLLLWVIIAAQTNLFNVG